MIQFYESTLLLLYGGYLRNLNCWINIIFRRYHLIWNILKYFEAVHTTFSVVDIYVSVLQRKK